MSQKPHVQTSRNFLYVLPVAVARSSSHHNATRYVSELDTNWMIHGLDWIGLRRMDDVFYVTEEPSRLSKNESCLTVTYLILLQKLV